MYNISVFSVKNHTLFTILVFIDYVQVYGNATCALSWIQQIWPVMAVTISHSVALN